MRILALDTSLGECSVAIMENSNVLYYIEEKEHHRQSERLILMIEHSLSKCQIDYKDIDFLATSVGPGSFTGIRIGISVVNGMALSLNKPVVNVTCLEAIAFSEPFDVCSVIDAGRNQVYAQKFKKDSSQYYEPICICYNELASYSSGYKIVGNKFADKLTLPNAKLVAEYSYNNILSKLSTAEDNTLNPNSTVSTIRDPRKDSKIKSISQSLSEAELRKISNKAIPFYIREPDAKANLKT